ncbi:hypothetical protein [Fulvimonas yonginensis]|uniref:DUF4405 domain-containing protein n=1 Tax=Fulvimonas yonginensis TaxID=1495200 RepID=A0ABU8JET4_9GAMM
MRAHHPRPSHAGSGIRLHPVHYRLLLAVLLLVGLTGIVWGILWDVLEREPDELLHWLTRLHGAGAFLALLGLGSLLAQHVRFGWNARRNRISGTVLGAFAAAIVLTGYALYYAGEDLRAWSVWIHLVLGTLAFIALPLHIRLGRRTRQRRGVPRHPQA